MKYYIVKDNNYVITKRNTLKELVTKEELIALPLATWQDIIIWKEGICPEPLIMFVLENKIKHYDKSKEVNSFYYKNKLYWLSKDTRIGLMNLVNCSKDFIQFVLGNEILTLDVNNFRKFLSELELYSSKCFINTQIHLNNIKSLKTVEDIINYDYTKGYPDKLIFDEYTEL